MIDKLIYAGIAAIAMFGLMLLYGSAKYQAGRADAMSEYSTIASKSQESMLKARTESSKRLNDMANALKAKEGQYNANVAKLIQQDKSYAAWRSQPIHPVAAGVYRGLRDPGAGAGGVPSRPDAAGTARSP